MGVFFSFESMLYEKIYLHHLCLKIGDKNFTKLWNPLKNLYGYSVTSVTETKNYCKTEDAQ